MNEGSFPRPLEGVSNEKKEAQKLLEENLREKFAIIRNAVNKKFGSENFRLIAKFFYNLLSSPDGCQSTLNELEIENTKQFPQRIEIVKQSLPLNLSNLPIEENFVESFTRAVTKQADYRECVYDGAQEQLENMSRLGIVRIWTAGDSQGVSTGTEFSKGTHGQMKKIALSEVVNDARNVVAKEKFSTDYLQYGEQRKNILSVRVAENKFDLIEDMISDFKAQGVEVVVVMDDILKYLIKFTEQVANHNLKVLPIWIRSEGYKNSYPKDSGHDLEYFIQQYNALDSISEVSNFLRSENIGPDSKAGFVVDYDGVIMDSEKKLAAQGDAIIAFLNELNVLTN